MTSVSAAAAWFARDVNNKPAWWIAVTALAAVGVYFGLQARRSWRQMPRSGRTRRAEMYDFLRYCFGAFCAASAIILGVYYRTGGRLRAALIAVAVIYVVGLGTILVYGARVTTRQRRGRNLR